MTDNTFHLTHDDIRKPESRFAHTHHGNTPADSNVSGLKSLVDENTNKPSEIEQHRTNLPLPEQPPTASDWQSATGKTVNVGSGATEGPFAGDNDTALRGPATAESSARQSQEELGRTTAPGGSVGRQGKENLQGLPKDAQAR